MITLPAELLSLIVVFPPVWEHVNVLLLGALQERPGNWANNALLAGVVFAGGVADQKAESVSFPASAWEHWLSCLAGAT